MGSSIPVNRSQRASRRPAITPVIIHAPPCDAELGCKADAVKAPLEQDLACLRHASWCANSIAAPCAGTAATSLVSKVRELLRPAPSPRASLAPTPALLPREGADARAGDADASRRRAGEAKALTPAVGASALPPWRMARPGSTSLSRAA